MLLGRLRAGSYPRLLFDRTILSNLWMVMERTLATVAYLPQFHVIPVSYESAPRGMTTLLRYRPTSPGPIRAGCTSTLMVANFLVALESIGITSKTASTTCHSASRS